ncbi:hypothetical protein BJY01DRAFT_244496 [Aspergillus pseudoustus]|uniref:Myb-like DNA-binding domain-containing protein n=1 Tax=Aspergillus pseudoustus TaxID=1810923 RepID=A0ABR4KJP5_9EURO
MSATVTVDEHISFLLSCIKTLTGKIDFAAVAREQNIVTPGAAYCVHSLPKRVVSLTASSSKRFSRLHKAHGIPATANANADGNGNANGEGAVATSTADQTQEQATGAKGKAGRKRPAANKGKGKAKAGASDAEPPLKKTRVSKKENVIKHEEQDDDEEGGDTGGASNDEVRVKAEHVDDDGVEDVYKDANRGEEEVC